MLLRDIRLESHCEHHMVPIIGRAHVAYLPHRRVVGISKLARVVEAYARRLQIQEKLTAQIANTIQQVLEPRGVAVVIEAAHQCMTTRGVHKPGVTMVTSRMLGAFRDDPTTRREVLAMIGNGSGLAATLGAPTMPHATTDDGVRLYYEETGSGTPVIFVHEYAGDYRSWEPQMRHFGQRYRAITYNARGYPPSDVPDEVTRYSQARAADDIKSVLDHLKIDKAHVVGLSMGGFATLHYGFRHPARALSLCVAGCGYGAEKGATERFRAEAETIAAFIAEQGMEVFAAKYAYGPTRVQFENKDPRGFAEFRRMLAEHSALGARNTQLGVQRERPSLYDLVDQMKALTLPTLILTGDEDWPCLQPGLLMKQTIASAALSVMPNCGHAINIEDPDEFNRIVGAFITQVDAGRWPTRDTRAVSASITGMR